MIKLIFFLITFSLLFSKENCTTNIFINNGFFKYQKSKTNAFNNNTKKYETKYLNSYTVFPECYIGNKKLFYYSYRKELKNVDLIQFIFKTNNNNFKSFSNKLLKSKVISNAIKKIKTKKSKTILEISTNKNLTFSYEIINGNIVKRKEKNNYK